MVAQARSAPRREPGGSHGRGTQAFRPAPMRETAGTESRFTPPARPFAPRDASPATGGDRGPAPWSPKLLRDYPPCGGPVASRQTRQTTLSYQGAGPRGVPSGAKPRMTTEFGTMLSPQFTPQGAWYTTTNQYSVG